MRLSTKTAVALAALLAVTGLVAPAQAQERLRPVGTVTYEPEPVSILKGVYKLRPEDRRVRSMRILAEEGSADVRSLNVIYEDGETETVRVRQVLQEGERTARFELEEVRPIRSIEISYLPKGAVTLVLLADPRRAEPPAPPQWTEISCKNVGLLGDRDTVDVTGDNRYQALRFRSANYDIELGSVAIRYADGSRDNYQIQKLIRAGGLLGPIDLRGERRRITNLEFVYRARTLGPFKTKLCIEGLKVGRPVADDEED
jgi:hypothetical protein